MATDFSSMSLEQMRALIDPASSSTVAQASDVWANVASKLRELEAVLGVNGETVMADWEGDAAEGFGGDLSDLRQYLRDQAEYAERIRDALLTISSEIDTAKNSMPEDSGWFSDLKDMATDLAGGGALAFVPGLGQHLVDSLTPADDDGTVRQEMTGRVDAFLREDEERRNQAVAVLQRYTAGLATARSKMVWTRVDDGEEGVISPSDASAGASAGAAGLVGGVGAGFATANSQPSSYGRGVTSRTGPRGTSYVQGDATSPSGVQRVRGVDGPAPENGLSTNRPGGGSSLPASELNRADAPTLNRSPSNTNPGPAPAGGGGGNTNFRGPVGLGDLASNQGRNPGGSLRPRGTRMPGQREGRPLVSASDAQRDTGAGNGRTGGARPGGGIGAGAAGGRGSTSATNRRSGVIGVDGDGPAGRSGTFTQGGSGIGRGSRLGGADPRNAYRLPNQQRAEEEERERRERADYLVEDEETWRASRSITPRVIDE
ncbi:WXG100 family type VII secretion target [Allostreptomyces psammosilenae]|uniref:WXG100 family type VII secretion target n=1 Tax=Allostreptomyces psammosilenae TaxID=1892865 RepID=A0A853A725_9ACTN|nr:hypothetical protein [Allostreptomyces psammosilenae]NYI06252.1 hypothetical protein [Allostreptomyces psammosilenae]